MNLYFDEKSANKYKSKSQKIRVMSENWVGKNMFCPCCGNAHILKLKNNKPVDKVVENYIKVKRLHTENINSRPWLFDVLSCVNNIGSDEFCLQDVYNYSEVLQKKHTQNHNVKAKIRQQLQLLRDKGFIEFLGKGYYKKRY